MFVNLIKINHFQIELIQTDQGACEINPQELFNNILKILRKSLEGINNFMFIYVHKKLKIKTLKFV